MKQFESEHCRRGMIPAPRGRHLSTGRLHTHCCIGARSIVSVAAARKRTTWSAIFTSHSGSTHSSPAWQRNAHVLMGTSMPGGLRGHVLP
jgi:hypothetical protein